MAVSDHYERVEMADRAAWRRWLEDHHAGSAGVWLTYAKKGSGLTSVSYDEAVEEALCFGWIDSKVRRLDEDRFVQLYTPRRAGSIWSRLNKERVERMIAAGRMTGAGMEKVETARADGSWARLDDVDALVVPGDLRRALDADPVAAANFEAFAPSRKRPLLFWIADAKRADTRERRIAETVRRARENTPFGE